MIQIKKLAMFISLISSSIAGHSAISLSTGDIKVQLSGVIDTGVASVTHVKDGGTKTQTKAVDSILGVSNIGFSGQYDIDQDYQAYFNLQAGFNPSRGEQTKDGELFDRNAYVGMKTPYGSASIGKQWTFNDDWFVGSVFKGGYNSGAIFKMSEFDAVSEIYSSTIKYSSPVYNHWQLGALYALKDSSAKNTHGQIYSLALKYAQDNILVGGAYENHQAENNSNHYQLTTLASSYKIDQFKTRLGIAYSDIDGPGFYASIAPNLPAQRAWATDLGLDYFATPKLTVSGDIIYKKNTTMDNHATVYRALAVYQIRQPIGLIANIAYLKNADGSSESLTNTDSGLVGGGYINQNQLSTALGVRLTF